MSCDMIRQGLALVCFVFTVRTVELEDASVSILAVLHLVETHVAMAAFITPEGVEYAMDLCFVKKMQFKCNAVKNIFSTDRMSLQIVMS